MVTTSTVGTYKVITSTHYLPQLRDFFWNKSTVHSMYAPIQCYVFYSDAIPLPQFALILISTVGIPSPQNTLHDQLDKASTDEYLTLHFFQLLILDSQLNTSILRVQIQVK